MLYPPTFGRAHPRSRGENSFVALIVIVPPGSSPLTRGKRRIWVEIRENRRLIPAHAGKTLTMTFRLDRLGAHPRSRGENDSQRAALDGPRGSSPLTRGKPVNDERAEGHGGLIPAHAGKT